MTTGRAERVSNGVVAAGWGISIGLILRACVGTAQGQTIGSADISGPDFAALAQWLLGQIHHGHAGTVVVIAAVFIVVKALRSYGGERWPVLRSPAGGAITGAVVSLLGGLLSVLVAGQPLSWDLAMSVLIGWWGASGGQSTLKDIGSLDFTPKTAPAAPVVGSPL